MLDNLLNALFASLQLRVWVRALIFEIASELRCHRPKQTEIRKGYPLFWIALLSYALSIDSYALSVSMHPNRFDTLTLP